MPKVVILSFTAALDYMAVRQLREEQLKEAVFALGCTRGWPKEPLNTILQQHARYQHNAITQRTLDLFCVNLDAAAPDGRALWRKELGHPHIVHNEMSKALRRVGLEPLNPNLPPVDENSFLKAAIERVNNKNGNMRVWAITDYGTGSH